MKTALVIGSAGFIGRHLCPKLKAAGYRVTGVDPKEENITSTSEYYCACTFEEWLRRANPPGGWVAFDVIIHLGVNTYPIDKRIGGGLEQYENILRDYAVAKGGSEHPPRECYIWPTSGACDKWGLENDPYAYSKDVGERFCVALHKQGVPVVMLRLFGGYGEDQGEGFPFGDVLARAMRWEDPLTVWGSLETARDWVHVDDIANAFVHAIDNFPRGIPIDIGTGVPVTVAQFARWCAEAVGYEPIITCDSNMPAGGQYRVADTTLARVHGWDAKIDLREGIFRAVGKPRIYPPPAKTHEYFHIPAIALGAPPLATMPASVFIEERIERLEREMDIVNELLLVKK